MSLSHDLFRRVILDSASGGRGNGVHTIGISRPRESSIILNGRRMGKRGGGKRKEEGREVHHRIR